MREAHDDPEDGEPRSSVPIDAARFAAAVDEILAVPDLVPFKEKVAALRASTLAGAPGPGTIEARRGALIMDFDQVLEAFTLERAVYYLKRLRRGIVEPKTGKINDLNLRRWKEHDEVLTDSLWRVDRRDDSGAHSADYWGNFVPQIPRQLMLRFTRRGDWVLDPFSGGGTTMIECRKLGRNGIGVELNPTVAARSRDAIVREPNPHGVATGVEVGDSRTLDFGPALANRGIDRVQLVLLHPPYHDIIRFSDDEADLSNAESTGRFLEMLGDVVDRVTPWLERGRYLALVLGDKYSRGEWIPLGFRGMNEVMKRGYGLKSIVVKNFEGTRGKRGSRELWRYRALCGGFYVFKHEYVFLFRKN